MKRQTLSINHETKTENTYSLTGNPEIQMKLQTQTLN